MELSLKQQKVLITGASSGIGQACAKQFAAKGADIIILARRAERLQALAQQLSQYHIECQYFVIDVQKKTDVLNLFQKFENCNIGIDILINNAGLALGRDKMQDAQISDWETMIDTNLKGLLYVTKAALPSMIQKNKGHIINIGSISAHRCYAGGSVYCATKHAVRAISQSLRMDLEGTAIRVSEIDPGAAETEFSQVRFQDKEKAKKVYEGFKPLCAEDIADAVVYCTTRPPHVNISEIILSPQAQL